MTWQFTKVGKIPKDMKNTILIEGLPGIGNVGKVVVDFIIDDIKAKKIYDIFSYTFPHSVFVNDKNLVELPSISLFHKKVGTKNILLLTGDVQPVDEIPSYEFTEHILNILQDYKCKEIITLGGIGLNHIPDKPKVYCTGNDKTLIKKYEKGTKLDNKIYGVVGPIIGVSGLLLGLGEKRKIPAISLLAETFSNPMFLGVKGSSAILKVLDKKLNMKLNLKKMNKEITEIEKEMMKRTEEFSQVSRQTALNKVQGKLGDTSYIG
ncbi:PAC2 family protein [Nanoarchaeota archaeon]